MTLNPQVIHSPQSFSSLFLESNDKSHAGTFTGPVPSRGERSVGYYDWSGLVTCLLLQLGTESTMINNCTRIPGDRGGGGPQEMGCWGDSPVGNGLI